MNDIIKLNAADEALPPDTTDDQVVAFKDQDTGLIWSKTLNTEELNHADCVKLVEDLEAKESKKWRMPTVKELLTLVDYEHRRPATNPVIAPDTKSDWYWTSTPVAGGPSLAWFVGFGSGDSDWLGRYYGGFVRAVRAGQ